LGLNGIIPMKFKSLLVLLSGMFVSQGHALDYTSTFTDNGNVILETRTFADNSEEEWEWLDLTITNSLSFNSIAADLANDGSLNNSDNSLVGLSNSIADVTSLAADEQFGWSAASDQDVVDLINAFFATDTHPTFPMEDGENIVSGLNSTLIEEFITTFGDTYHEGRDDAGFTSSDANPSLPNIGFAQGITGTVFAGDVNFNEIVSVEDGQYFYSTSDTVTDRIITTSNYLNDASDDYLIGTWLIRQKVDEPGTILMFGLAMLGLAVRRMRQKN